MPGYYTCLIASLPMLHFGMSAPFSFQGFLEICQDIISKDDIAILKSAYYLDGEEYLGNQPTLKKWYNFDLALRNELVKIRSSRRHIDPAKYMRKDGYVEPYISHIAISAYRNTSIIEAERALDQERWRALDEFRAGHYFDLDILIAYVRKLAILERWQKINSADKDKLLQEVLTAKGS